MKNAFSIEQYLPGKTATPSGNCLLVSIRGDELAESVRALIGAGLPVLTVCATDERTQKEGFKIRYAFGLPAQKDAPSDMNSIVLVLALQGESFPSLSREFPGFSLYEREIFTMFGLRPEEHPDLRSLALYEENWPREMYPLRKDFKWDARIPETHAGEYRFHTVEGEGVYEIPVGPVHAGIIEPGNFRFSVMGEEIIQLEARLGWVHKGTEKLFESLPVNKSVELAEHISGDSAFSHSLAFCQALEALTSTKIPKRAAHLRLVFAELERLTMHLFDIGNIAGNGTGFSFMAAQGFRMVENMRRKSVEMTENRFWKGVNVPGGLEKDISNEIALSLKNFLKDLQEDFSEVVNIADRSASLANRLLGTGEVSPQVVKDYFGVGMAARCCNMAKDARVEYPYAAYGGIAPEIALEKGCDVDARFRVRIKEVFESIALIERALASIPEGPTHAKLNPIPKSGTALGIVEGWRGEIVHMIVAEEGAISRVKVRDPSFMHWRLFSHLVSRDMVPDFPLINKSFNLSYSGNDL